MSECIKISSVKRVHGDSSNFIADFSNSPIEKGQYFLFSSVFGNSFYNINDYNNKIYFKEGSTSLTATLTNGFYNSTNIISNIKSAMETISLALGAGLTYTCSLNSTTNKITILVSSGTFQMLMGSNIINSARYLLGFTTDTTAQSVLTGDVPINLTDSPSYNLRIDAHGIKNNLRDNNNNFYSFSVPILSNSLDVFLYEPVNAPIIEFENRASQLRISVYNEDGDPVVLLHDYYFILSKVL